MPLHGMAGAFQDPLSKSIHEHHGHRDLDALSTSRHDKKGPLNDPLSRSRHDKKGQLYDPLSGSRHDRSPPRSRASMDKLPISRTSLEQAVLKDPLSLSQKGMVTLRDVEKSRQNSMMNLTLSGKALVGNGEKKSQASSGTMITAAHDLVGILEVEVGKVRDSRIHLPKITPEDDPQNTSQSPSNSPSHSHTKSRSHSQTNNTSTKQGQTLSMLPLNTPEGHVSSLGVPKESLSATAAAAAGGGSVQDTVIPYDHVGLDHSQKSTKEQVLLDKIEKLIQSKSNKSEKSDKGSPTVISGTPAYDLDKPDSYLDNTTHDGSWPITNNSRAHSPEVGGGVGHGHAGGGIPPPTHRRDSNPLTRRKKVTLFGTKAVSGRTAALHDSETAGGSFWIDGERVW